MIVIINTHDRLLFAQVFVYVFSSCNRFFLFVLALTELLRNARESCTVEIGNYPVET